ncbi:TRAP transporter small permease [Desulforhopalus singaporensis]|uniref:Tripartite ATP-independent transporter, DctQ component n=1 Tax=Desulforhopalus singaporensis TaxID=91360 RepID=A0A1H0STE2_9BACT|nr:TRAP transporter small permease [Desulforhopalus singaporensis]SDP44516.1 Tripartite ATP-independent transporter, DctQ component [Desulforhopalus singaporensis]
MQSIVRKISKLVTVFMGGGASLSMAVVFIVVFLNSLRRYTIGKSFEWGEELPIFVAIYGIMFGSAWAYLEDRHIKFTMLVGFLSEKTSRYLFMLVDLVMVITGSLLAYSGYLFAAKRGAMESSGMINLAKQLTAITGLKHFLVFGTLYPYQAAMIGGGIMVAIAAILKFLQRLTDGAPSCR